MNKVKTLTQGDYRVVYINDIPSKKFHILGDDYAYTNAEEYAYKALTMSEYPVLFTIPPYRLKELKKDYNAIEFNLTTSKIHC